MRLGVVSLSLVAKVGRLDANFYIGDDEERRIERATRGVVNARLRLRNAKLALAKRNADRRRLGVKFIALVLLALTACASDPGPVVTYALDVPDVSLEADLDHALGGWATIGLVRVHPEDGDVPDIAAVRIERVPVADLPDADGRTWREWRLIQIRDSLVGNRLLIVIAHEVGHAMLDTGRHTQCGIMSGSDTLPCNEDIALACERVGLGCKGEPQ
jgi:hypothetical protein